MIQIPRKNKILKKITDRYLEITPRDISKIYNEKFNFQYFFFSSYMKVIRQHQKGVEILGHSIVRGLPKYIQKHLTENDELQMTFQRGIVQHSGYFVLMRLRNGEEDNELQVYYRYLPSTTEHCTIFQALHIVYIQVLGNVRYIIIKFLVIYE